MKLPSFYTDLCFKQVFENATAGCNSPCRSVLNSASCELQSVDCLFELVEGRLL